MTRPHSKGIAVKAAAIIAERRIKPFIGAKVFAVEGTTDDYVVTVWGRDEDDVACTCEAGRRSEALCSHASYEVSRRVRHA